MPLSHKKPVPAASPERALFQGDFSMRKYRFFVCLLCAALLMPSAAAHPGRTDANGGHNDNSNASGLGPYHYHHGYPAHLHTGGVCPYNFSDKTGSSSGGSSSRAAIGSATIASDRYNEGYGDGYDDMCTTRRPQRICPLAAYLRMKLNWS